MSENKDFNPIESALYLRQRKTLITVAVLITAVNLIGGQIKTGEDGSSAFVLPFGITFEVARPWAIDWLLLVALVYLLIRYFIFSRYVRQNLNKYRHDQYCEYLKKLETSLKDVNLGLVTVKNFFWFWTYSFSKYHPVNELIDEKQDQCLSGWVTLLPSLKIELKMFLSKNAYTDYYSPYIMVVVALCSYYFKI